MGLGAMLHAAFHDTNTRIYRYVQGLVSGLIFLSILLLVLEAIGEGRKVDETVPLLDRVLLAIFAVEILLRVGSYRPPTLAVFRGHPLGRLRTHLLARLAYLLRPLMLVDVLAVLAFFPELRGLRVLRLLRLLRVTKVFRYKNPFAIALQALEENGLLLRLALVLVASATLLGGATIYLLEYRVNPGLDTILDAIWWALVTITTVGYGDITPVTLLGRIVGACLMVAGMFSLAMFAGVIGASLVNRVLSIREEQFRMSNHVNHVVVCGYDESTHILLDALAKELKFEETPVVLFDDHERPRDLEPDFLWVQGDPTKESELDKVSLTRAAAVIVSGERDTSPQVADARTILITFTIGSYLGKNSREVERRRSPLYVVAEILDSENVQHAFAAGANEVIETRRIGYSLIAHALRYHGIATAMSHVLLSGEHSVYVGLIPRGQSEPERFGDLLIRLRLSERGGLIVGLRTPAGKEIINPPKSCLVEPGTQLLYLAEAPLLEPPR